MYYHKIVYSFEQHGGSGGSGALLNGPYEALNFRDMLFLGAQFRFMPRVVISLRSGSNLQSSCICGILKPRCSYNLCTCMIPSAVFSIFRFLIILPMENMTCRDMVLRKTIPLMCMRSQEIVTSSYLSRIVLGTLVILTGSTCWILKHTVCLLGVVCWAHRYNQPF